MASELQWIWGTRAPEAGMGGFQLFFQAHVLILSLFAPDPLSQGFCQLRLGSLPATFLQVDVAFLSSLILITLEFMNPVSKTINHSSTLWKSRQSRARLRGSGCS